VRERFVSKSDLLHGGIGRPFTPKKSGDKLSPRSSKTKEIGMTWVPQSANSIVGATATALQINGRVNIRSLKKSDGGPRTGIP
jgi:hypothetical protein